MELCFHHPEFEQEVRSRLGIFDRPITERDIVNVTELDLTNFDFPIEDRAVLCLCRNLSALAINIGYTTPDFWFHFPRLQSLAIQCWEKKFDFESFRNIRDLESLFVSGGDISSIPYKNLGALLNLQKLKSLELHEFGTVDLQPLGQMHQLRSFALCYPDEVSNIDVIGTMDFLDVLILIGLRVQNLDFLDTLPNRLSLDMCGLHVRDGVDVSKWKRFASRDICEISVGDSRWNYISLAALEE